MRGRTNIGGGGLEINGDTVQYTVKSGVTINEGDFVQIDDSITPTTVSESIGNTNANIFDLSDGRQICFYIYSTTIKAIIESVDTAGIVTATIKTILNNYAGGTSGGLFVIKLNADSFMIAIPRIVTEQSGSNYYASNYFDFYKIDYDVSNDTFVSTECGTLSLVSGITGSSYSNYRCKPALFIMRKLDSTKLFIVCDRNQSTTVTLARTEAIVYDFVSKTIIANYREDTLSMTSGYQGNIDDYLTQINTNKFVFVMPYVLAGGSRNRYLFIYDYDGSSIIIRTLIDKNEDFFGVINGYGNNKFLTAFKTAVNLCMIVNNTLSIIDTFVAPFEVNRIYYIHDKIFISNNTNNDNLICEVVYNSATDEITFSAVSSAVLYTAKRIETENQFLSSYYGTSRRTAKEIGGNFFSFDLLQTVKKYVNRIDGVSAEGGTGGDTITIFVPST